ncbi:HXXEE domain-containing protein [Patescibacteria group bacterium]|nr:HXXEE domain-containing protein [Patescibacteria group bacterium]
MQSKLNKLFLISLVLIYLHGVEEIVTGFQHVDSFMVYFASVFSISTESFYWVSHIIWWVSLPFLYLIFSKTKYSFYLLALYGVVFFTEIHHLVKAILSISYYPGMITAMLYPLFGIFYWRQILNEWRLKKG